MERLWVRLGEILGSKFLKQYGDVGDETFITWCLVCADLTTNQIANGFKVYMRSDDNFIDAKKFRGLCLSNDQKESHKIKTNWLAYKPYAKPKQLDNDAKQRSERARKVFINTIKDKLK